MIRFGALLDQVCGVFDELSERLDDEGVDVGHVLLVAFTYFFVTTAVDLKTLPKFKSHKKLLGFQKVF